MTFARSFDSWVFRVDSQDREESQEGCAAFKVGSDFLLRIGVRNSPGLSVLLESAKTSKHAIVSAKQVVQDFMKQEDQMRDHDWQELKDSAFLPGLA